MKKYKYIFMRLIIGAMLLCMLSSCSLEKRIVITTRGHEASFPNEHHVPRYELWDDYDSSPRDTVLNHKIPI